MVLPITQSQLQVFPQIGPVEAAPLSLLHEQVLSVGRRLDWSVAAISVVVASATSITSVTRAGTAGAKDVRGDNFRWLSDTDRRIYLFGSHYYKYFSKCWSTCRGHPGHYHWNRFDQRGDGDNWRRSSNQRHGRKCNLHYCGYTGWYRWRKNVVVTISGGAATLTGGFIYAAIPTITSVSPNSGPLSGGTPVPLPVRVLLVRRR